MESKARESELAQALLRPLDGVQEHQRPDAGLDEVDPNAVRGDGAVLQDGLYDE